MSYVVRNGVADRPQLRTRRRSRVGGAIAVVFTVFAFIVVACSGDNGNDEQGLLDEQGQRICNQDEGCEPPPREP